MSLGPDELLEVLGALERETGKVDRYIIGLSGGLDSTLLADLLSETRDRHSKALLAIHVDHGLLPTSSATAEHCRQFARERSINFELVTVDVDLDSGKGIEAAARSARYAAFETHMGPRDWLLCAHHEDDQAETLLLNLLRGSGPLGIAAMPAVRRFSEGWLVRPLLHVSRARLEELARARGLEWQEDPSNADTRFDRNFLRREILPGLSGRWPDVSARLARSASLSADAATLIDELADIDLESLADANGRLSVPGLKELSRSRRLNAVRRAARCSGLTAPPATQLEEIDQSLLCAREDAEPEVHWTGGEARRFRDRLYLLAPIPDAPVSIDRWNGESPIDLGPGLGRLRIASTSGTGLDPEIVRRGLSLRTREGGEMIRAESQGPTRKLKKLLNEAAIVPWMRDRLPMLYSGDRLVAVADLWTAAEAETRPGLSITWEDAPALD